MEALRRVVPRIVVRVPAGLRQWIYRHPMVSRPGARLMGYLMPSDRPILITVPDGPNAGLKMEVDQSVPRYYWLRRDHDAELVGQLKQRTQPGMVAMDVGANIGFNTMMLARWVGRSGRVISFEPDPKNMRRLRRHCEINGLSNVEFVPQALSDRTGRLRFAAIGEGTSQVLKDGCESPEIVMVESVRMDELVGSLDLGRLDVIKIDVEDHEVAVLRGARETLIRFRPFLLIEVHSLDSLIGCNHELTQLGYTVKPIDTPELYHRLLSLNDDQPNAEDMGSFERGQIIAIPPER